MRLNRVSRSTGTSTGDKTAVSDLLDHRECQGLNDSHMVAAVWNTESHEALTAPRGFAITHEGDLLTLSVGSGSKGPCKVRKGLPDCQAVWRW